MNCGSGYVLNVMNGNIKLSGFNTRKLKKYKSVFLNVADRHVSLSGKKRLIVERREFLLPLLCAIYRPREAYEAICTSFQPINTVGDTRLLPSPRERKKRSRLKQKPNPYEKWVKMRNKIREADIRRKTRTKAMSDFLRRVMPDTTTGSCLPPPSPQSQI